MKKILIAVPCMDQIPSRFAYSLAMLKKVEECALTFEIGSLIYTSRDNIAKKAIEMEADYVFWLDSDMIFEPNTLERLLARMEEDKTIDIITGLYFRRVPPFSPVLFDRLDIDVEKDVCFWTEFKDVPEGVFDVGGCGFGCVLMTTDVIMNVFGRFRKMFTPLGGAGEDLAFCWRARQCGFRIVCDSTVQLGHVGTVTVTRDFFNNYQAAKG